MERFHSSCGQNFLSTSIPFNLFFDHLYTTPIPTPYQLHIKAVSSPYHFFSLGEGENREMIGS